eukprot:4065878-Pyramimonas_sp.AAC.1
MRVAQRRVEVGLDRRLLGDPVLISWSSEYPIPRVSRHRLGVGPNHCADWLGVNASVTNHANSSCVKGASGSVIRGEIADVQSSKDTLESIPPVRPRGRPPQVMGRLPQPSTHCTLKPSRC